MSALTAQVVLRFVIDSRHNGPVEVECYVHTLALNTVQLFLDS